MQIKRTPEQIAEFWNKARRADDDPDNDYAHGAYATIQWLTGNGDEPELEDE